jgi:uncharacterized protein
MDKELPFDPFPLFKNAHEQTIFGGFLYNLKSPASVTREIALSDKAKITCEVSTPKSWKNNDLTVFMVHGLCGSHKSPCIVRLAHPILNRGARTVRINLRNCGTGKGLSRSGYHGGLSADILEVLKVFRKESPNSPFVLLAISLGGNIILKLGGELGSKGYKYLNMIISLNPPINLYSSVQLVDKKKGNRMYQKYFIKLLKEGVEYLQTIYPDLPKRIVPRDSTFFQFDEIYTTKCWNFKDPFHYYDVCSSVNYIPDIKIPTKILISDDDPIIDSRDITNVYKPKDVIAYHTKKGGHLGYLGSFRDKRGFFWLDNLVLEWLSPFFNN